MKSPLVFFTYRNLWRVCVALITRAPLTEVTRAPPRLGV